MTFSFRLYSEAGSFVKLDYFNPVSGNVTRGTDENRMSGATSVAQARVAPVSQSRRKLAMEKYVKVEHEF